MAEPRYSHLLFTGLKDDMPNVIDYMSGPSAYFRGAHQIPGASINMGWQVIIKPTFMEKAPHTHDCDEYFAILGAQLPDVFSSFDAEIELWMGPERRNTSLPSPHLFLSPRDFCIAR